MRDCRLRLVDGVGLPPAMRPKVTDDDEGTISIDLNGERLREYSYEDDAGRRIRMQKAWEYIEGWCDAMEHRIEVVS